MKPPKPHIPKNLRAFVLGCDPTAFKDKEKRVLKELKTVFGICEDRRYFAGILSNLKALGLGQDDVYVQNLVTEYLGKETSNNKKEWKEKARKSIGDRKKEFDLADPSGKLPVFLTSYLLYEVLLNDGLKRKTAKELYDGIEIIPASSNQLNRPLVPLFRHYTYGYKYKLEYFNKVAELFLSP
jgi:hypothetical protein